MASDVQTTVIKILSFAIYHAEKKQDLTAFIEDLKKYKGKMEKQQYLLILEELELLEGAEEIETKV